MRLLAVQLYIAGLPMRRVAGILGVSSTTIARWLHHFAEIHREPLVQRGQAAVVPPQEVAHSALLNRFSAVGTLTLCLQAHWLSGETGVIARPAWVARGS